jgi:hypothetical protein
MKRTEALKLIEDQYSKFIESFIELDTSDDESMKEFTPLNELILSALENAGMLPPFAHLKKLGTLDTAWEPEDE